MRRAKYTPHREMSVKRKYVITVAGWQGGRGAVELAADITLLVVSYPRKVMSNKYTFVRASLRPWRVQIYCFVFWLFIVGLVWLASLRSAS